MKINDYKDLVATPQAHVEFLRHVVGLMEGVAGEGQDASRQLYSTMRDGIDVGGTQFSQARHLLALEKSSGDLWDLEETSPQVLREALDLSQKIQEFDPGYKVRDFTVGVEWMKELAGDADFTPSR